MTLRLGTTTVTVRRATRVAGSDDHDPPGVPADIATGVRAHFDQPTGDEATGSGSRSRVDRILLCDVTDLTHTDAVVDETTGATWAVEWVDQVTHPYLAHLRAGVARVQGAPQ